MQSIYQQYTGFPVSQSEALGDGGDWGEWSGGGGEMGGDLIGGITANVLAPPFTKLVGEGSARVAKTVSPSHLSMQIEPIC